MPEGPELKLSAENLQQKLAGTMVREIQISESGRFYRQPPALLDKFLSELKTKTITIDSVQVKGKFMYWTLSHNWFMFITYGMTGQWSKYATEHCAMTLQYERPPMRAIWSLYFNDPRHFGTIKFSNNPQDLQDKLNSLGWDPFTGITPLNLQLIFNKLKNHKTIAESLMNQKIFAGVGNYIKSEALYAAQISPWRISNSLSVTEIERLCQAIVDVMTTSYHNQGATLATYVDPDGQAGKHSDFFKVYHKKQDGNGYSIKRETTLDKRTSFWVPEIQT